MKPIRGACALVLILVFAMVPVGGAAAQAVSPLIITGVIDGPLSGGLPKAVEVLATDDIADLSAYSIGSANNGGGSDGPEFTFPAVSADAGTYLYVASETDGFMEFFGFAPDYTSSAASINGDDAIELFSGGVVVDIFGDVDVDGNGQAWEYTDGWAKRIDGTGPDGTTFQPDNWTFSGPNALDGASTNDGAATPFPLGDDDPSSGGGGEDPVAQAVKIHEIQGSTDTANFEEEPVIIEGVVVADFETFDQLAGFFVQEEDADTDDDPKTSEGIFVFNANADSVQPGQLVQVEGTVEERFGNTQLTDSVVTVLGDSTAVATPATVELPLDARSDLEAVEGMLATFPQTLVISEYFNFDRFGETLLALPQPGEDRLYQPTAVAEPGSAEAAEIAEYNALSTITVDDGRTSENPDPAIHPGNGEVFDLENRFRGGDTITGITGAIYFGFDQYRIMPTEYGVYERVNERTDEPEEVGGELTVASLNALNYFLTLDDGSDAGCGPNLDMECRGADADQPNELERQRAKLLATLETLDADVIGLNEIENTPGVEPLADLAAGLNERLGARTYDYIDTGVVGTDAIRVGILYKPASVTPVAQPAILDSPEFLDPLDTGENKNRAAVAQSFLEKGTGERFSVVVNHLKSKGSACGEGDDDPIAGNCDLTRTLAAAELAAWIETDPTNIKDDDWLIIGDLNSYDEEAPIRTLEAAGYTDLLDDADDDAYSYLFSGQLGYLDYVMVSESALGQVTGATVWHINADEPDILDYDTSFKQDPQDELYAPTPYRSSDHDPVLVGLDLDSRNPRSQAGNTNPGQGP